jgi:hypothetical protein
MEPPSKIVILCNAAGNRLRYVADFLESTLAIKVQISIKPASSSEIHALLQKPENCVIHYGNQPLEGAFNIFEASLVGEYKIRPQVPAVIVKDNLTLIFPAPAGFDLPFDLFSAIFYLLSRYEEYLPFAPDQYGRFDAKQSLAFQHGFLEKPVVDQWLILFKSILEKRFPTLKFSRQEFRFVSTIDVDYPWAYLHKGFVHTAGGFIKHCLKFNFSELRQRTDVLRNRRPDPYDTYDYIRQIEQQYNFRSMFFFLLGNCGKYDTNYALSSPQFSKLLNDLKADRVIGIHPSFKSNKSLNLLKFEFNRLTRFLGKEPEISRQHFLMLRLPDTYRNLISLNVQTDYSMGYASRIGFRAGTSRPFRFYDLIRDEATSLVIHPFVVMDVTMRQYMNLSPGEATAKIGHLLESVRAVNGVFTSIWHNDSLSEHGVWRGWRVVFEEMVKKVKSEK